MLVAMPENADDEAWLLPTATGRFSATNKRNKNTQGDTAGPTKPLLLYD